ncbi:MAG: hypothetical protein LQ352_002218 [Teloschistes flavicans]|nr:MAG: hypothetical protein LQ352_002218 [Teloschistes flavicans]
MTTSLEAKICILGAQGVGKTSLVQRYVKGTFTPSATASTVGASFLTKRVLDIDSGMTVRLQLWDTAGQERFRSISKLYYRGASAVLLVYSIVDEQSFQEMGRWMKEVKENVGNNVIIHVVGTKSDVVAQDPGLRMVPFERCIAYVAENFFSAQGSTASPTTAGMSGIHSLDSKRSSGIWGQDTGWDCCNEISAKDGEGIEEVFRVITRRLVDEKIKRAEQALATETSTSPGFERSQAGYFDGPGSEGHGSFRVGIGDKRRSWLGFPTPNIGGEERDAQTHDGTPTACADPSTDNLMHSPNIRIAREFH